MPGNKLDTPGFTLHEHEAQLSGRWNWWADSIDPEHAPAAEQVKTSSETSSQASGPHHVEPGRWNFWEAPLEQQSSTIVSQPPTRGAAEEA